MWTLYVKTDSWTAYATFAERTGDYATQVKEGIARAKQSLNESKRAAATVMEGFVLGNTYYARKDGKLVLRALRHFDEVGLSNEICEKLEEALDEGLESFALVGEWDGIEKYTQGAFAVVI